MTEPGRPECEDQARVTAMVARLLDGFMGLCWRFLCRRKRRVCG